MLTKKSKQFRSVITLPPSEITTTADLWCIFFQNFLRVGRPACPILLVAFGKMGSNYPYFSLSCLFSFTDIMTSFPTLYIQIYPTSSFSAIIFIFIIKLYCSLFNRSSIEGHLNYLHFLALINNIAVNILVHISLCFSVKIYIYLKESPQK